MENRNPVERRDIICYLFSCVYVYVFCEWDLCAHCVYWCSVTGE